MHLLTLSWPLSLRYIPAFLFSPTLLSYTQAHQLCHPADTVIGLWCHTRTYHAYTILYTYMHGRIISILYTLSELSQLALHIHIGMMHVYIETLQTHFWQCSVQLGGVSSSVDQSELSWLTDDVPVAAQKGGTTKRRQTDIVEIHIPQLALNALLCMETSYQMCT